MVALRAFVITPKLLLAGLCALFLLVAPPLPVSHAVGTPINPYAMK